MVCFTKKNTILKKYGNAKMRAIFLRIISKSYRKLVTSFYEARERDRIIVTISR